VVGTELATATDAYISVVGTALATATEARMRVVGTKLATATGASVNKSLFILVLATAEHGPYVGGRRGPATATEA
jgi:hypothetical protein